MQKLSKRLFIIQIEITLTPFENAKKMPGQNTFKIFLLNDANMIGEH